MENNFNNVSILQSAKWGAEEEDGANERTNERFCQ